LTVVPKAAFPWRTGSNSGQKMRMSVEESSLEAHEATSIAPPAQYHAASRYDRKNDQYDWSGIVARKQEVQNAAVRRGRRREE